MSSLQEQIQKAEAKAHCRNMGIKRKQKPRLLSAKNLNYATTLVWKHSKLRDDISVQMR